MQDNTDSDDAGYDTYHGVKMRLQREPKLTYKQLVNLLQSNKDKSVITVNADEYEKMSGCNNDCNCQGPCTCGRSATPNTEINGENPTESGHTYDGLDDYDQIRRRKNIYSRGE